MDTSISARGRLGGLVRSEAKTHAAQMNGRGFKRIDLREGRVTGETVSAGAWARLVEARDELICPQREDWYAGLTIVVIGLLLLLFV